MRETHARFGWWLFPVLWAGLIFTVSADTDSSARSSRLIGPVVRWLFPEVSPETLELTVFAIRKAAHVTEYAILAVLTWLALRPSRPHRDPAGRPASWAVALLLTAAYALSDELHQTRVPGRTGAVADVFLDVLGAAAGLLVVEQWQRWRERRKGRRGSGGPGPEKREAAGQQPAASPTHNPTMKQHPVLSQPCGDCQPKQPFKPDKHY